MLVKFIFILSVFFSLRQAAGSPLFSSDTTQRGTSTPLQKKQELFWFSLGGGVLGPYIGGDFKATYAWDQSSISAKISGASELAIFGPPSNEVIEYGLYYGKQKYNDLFLGRIAAGVAYFTGRRHGIDDIHNFGIGAEAEAMLKYEFAGLSLLLNAVASPQFFYVGIMLNLNVGILN